MSQNVLINEIHDLIVKYCVKCLGNIQACGIFVNVFGSNKHHPHKIYVIAHGFANVKNNEQKGLIIEDSEILSKISLLYEKTMENWDGMFIICDIKANKFYIEFFNLYNPVRWDNIVDFPKKLKYYKFKLKTL